MPAGHVLLLQPASNWDGERCKRTAWKPLYPKLQIRHPIQMPIVAFHNNHEASLALVVEPWGEKHEIPHRSTAGIRYTLQEGAEDRSHCAVSEGQIDFWCNADGYEIDIVHPSACDNLFWDICVIGGWCGGIVNGVPTYVDDLLPETGIVTAEEFARLAVRADGWPDAEPVPAKHLLWLKGKFIEHLGASEVPSEKLRQITPRPFGHAQP